MDESLFFKGGKCKVTISILITSNHGPIYMNVCITETSSCCVAIIGFRGNWTFRPLAVCAPWTIRPIQVDVSPYGLDLDLDK